MSRREPADEVADYVRLQVRAGLLDEALLRIDVATVIAADVRTPDPDRLADELIAAARVRLAEESPSWAEVTDFDRLQQVFDELALAGVVVMQAVDDHWAANAELERRDEAGERVEGIAWFTPADVWHAIDHGMLEINVWHGDSANAAPGDQLLDQVIDVFARYGLAAHFEEGRIEVAAHWDRRP